MSFYNGALPHEVSHKFQITKCLKLQGTCAVPPDKSILHRALIIGALAQDEVRIRNRILGKDVLSSMDCLLKLGLKARFIEKNLILMPNKSTFKSPIKPLDCGNSGTTMRLLCGLLSPMGLNLELDGDNSLRRRPMKRVSRPLQLMGANIKTSVPSLFTTSGIAPVVILPSNEWSYKEIELSVPSAQVKSACLLAGVQTTGVLVKGGKTSRDHSERMLKAMGAKIETFENGNVIIAPGPLCGMDITVPGDFSSAAFVIAAALLIPESDVHIQGVNVNPTRTGFLDVLLSMGANIEIEHLQSEVEPIANLRVRYSQLSGTTVPQEWIPTLIDELPILALLATQAIGTTTVQGAEELRHKESDRIESTCAMIRGFNAVIDDSVDGFQIQGPQQLVGAEIEPHHDHRIAMAACVGGMIASDKTRVNQVDCIGVSFPGFLNLFGSLGADIESNKFGLGQFDRYYPNVL